MKIDKVTLLVIGLLFFSFLLIAVVWEKLESDSEQCLNDPLVFGAKNLEESNGAEVSCTCSLLKPNTPTISFNGNSSKIDYPYGQGGEFSEIDFNYSLSENTYP